MIKFALCMQTLIQQENKLIHLHYNFRSVKIIFCRINGSRVMSLLYYYNKPHYNTTKQIYSVTTPKARLTYKPLSVSVTNAKIPIIEDKFVAGLVCFFSFNHKIRLHSEIEKKKRSSNKPLGEYFFIFILV